ncbi:MAG: LUD domain-containing protein [Verrucomicrobiota bacterium]|jgi:L-lactate dehydrogenase complex protein LldG
MSERENILGRIREALRTAAPRPGGHGEGPAQTVAEPPVAHAREWLPAVGASSEEQFELFAKNCADLKADFQRLAGRDEMKAALAKIRDAEKWQRIASHAGELSNFACQALGLPTLLTDQGYDVQALEKCDAGITECDALIAQTGGVVVTSRSTSGRALTILPPHHVVIARQDQLLPDLPSAFAFLQQKYAPDFPSMISFITGPSRTGDIERILVLGAHGPKKLTILCV